MQRHSPIALFSALLLLIAAPFAYAAQPDAPTTDSLSVHFTPHVGKKFSKGPKGQRLYALTFDDGPHPRYTPQIVEILKAENVPATFFMLGEMIERYPDVARLVQEAGFEIGTHSWSHAQLTGKSEVVVRDEIIKTQDLAEQTFGARPRLFRPPYGSVNATVRRVAASDGLILAMWSVDPRDWDANVSVQQVVRKTVDSAPNGSIVVLHDIKSKTVEALPDIIRELRAAGFEFVPFSRMIEERELEGDATETEAPVSGGDPPPPAEPLVISLDETE